MINQTAHKTTQNFFMSKGGYKRGYNKHASEVCSAIIDNALALANVNFPGWDRATLQFDANYQDDPVSKTFFNALVSQFAICIISNFSGGDVKTYSKGGSFGILEGNIDDLTPELLEERMHLVAAQIFGRAGYRSFDFVTRPLNCSPEWGDGTVCQLIDLGKLESDPQSLLVKIQNQIMPAQKKRWEYATRQVVEGMLNRNANSTNPAGNLHDMDIEALKTKTMAVEVLKPLSSVRQEVLSFYQWLLLSLRENKDSSEFLTQVIGKCESLAEADPYGYIGESKLVFDVLIYSLKLRLQSAEIDSEFKSTVTKLKESGDYDRFLNDAIRHLEGLSKENLSFSLFTDCLIFTNNHFGQDEVQPTDGVIDMLCEMLLLTDTHTAIGVFERLSHFPTVYANLKTAYFDKAFNTSYLNICTGLKLLQEFDQVDENIHRRVLRFSKCPDPKLQDLACRVLFKPEQFQCRDGSTVTLDLFPKKRRNVNKLRRIG